MIECVKGAAAAVILIAVEIIDIVHRLAMTRHMHNNYQEDYKHQGQMQNSFTIPLVQAKQSCMHRPV